MERQGQSVKISRANCAVDPKRPQFLAQMRKRRIFTTGQVAKLCGVAPRTAAKWFDTGLLKGYRIPHSQDRRIPRESILAFMRKYGFGMEGLIDGRRVMFMTVDAVLGQAVADALGDTWQTIITPSAFGCGLTLGTTIVDVAVLDRAVGAGECDRAADALSMFSPPPRVVGIMAEDQGLDTVNTRGYHAVLPGGCDPLLVVNTILKMVTNEGDADEEHVEEPQPPADASVAPRLQAG